MMPARAIRLFGETVPNSALIQCKMMQTM